MFPEIDAVQLETLPFEHFIGNGEIHANRMAWLDWLEQKAPWRLTAEEFYEQYEFSLIHTLLPPVVQQLVCQNTLSSLRHLMFTHFRQPMAELVDVTAHKLVSGQTIRIHNDFISGGESHRLLLQLNRRWNPDCGGYLMLFSGSEPESVSKVIEPVNGSILAFSISPCSYHAVSTVHAGERYTVVYSFYPASR